MADTSYLKENLKGFVPSVTSNEIIGMAVRGSSILRLSKVEMMESDNKTFSVMKSSTTRLLMYSVQSDHT
mgnify:CR=1 FL=1